MRQSKLFPKPQEANGKPSGMENVMAKPTVLLEIDPFLLGSPYVPSFIHQATLMAQQLEHRFGGVSLKLTGSDSKDIVAEFRWQGSTVIKVTNLGSKDRPEQISAYGPFRTSMPSKLFRTWADLWDVFDSAFLDVIERELVDLNELRLKIKSWRLSRPWSD